jgi:AcrR family transcriptional regulator
MTKTLTDTREHLIESARRVIFERGSERTTIVDIARAAGVARGTVYAYFDDKDEIIAAVARHASQQFYRDMIQAMAGESTLEGQMSAAAVFVVDAVRPPDRADPLTQHDRALLLTTNASSLFMDCIEFFKPYIASAKVTGEVRRDLDVDAAAEWFARILFSLASTPTSVLDLDDPNVVRRFVGDHIVRGFGDTANGRSRSER